MQAQTPRPSDDRWSYAVGIGLVALPSHPGATSTRSGIRPSFLAQKGRWSVGVLPNEGIPWGAAYDVAQTGGWRLGLAAGPGVGKARSANQSPLLRGWGDVPSPARISAYANYDDATWMFSAQLVRDAGGTGPNLGTRTMVGAERRLRLSHKASLSVGPAVVWADEQNNQTFYGLTPAQARLAGLRAYRAEGGIQSVNLNVAASLQFTPHWALVGRASWAQLRASASKSPLVLSRNQPSLNAFAVYRF